MSRVIRRRWSSDFTAPTRAGNKFCEYEAYVPDPLVGRNIVLSGEVACVAQADDGDPITLVMLLDLHRRLLAGTRLAAHGGRLREVQNWIGGRRARAQPVVTVNSAAELIDRGFAQTNQAIARLIDAGILRQVTVGRRNRTFEVVDVIDAFTDLERRLASPVGDTRTSEPTLPSESRRGNQPGRPSLGRRGEDDRGAGAGGRQRPSLAIRRRSTTLRVGTAVQEAAESII